MLGHGLVYGRQDGAMVLLNHKDRGQETVLVNRYIMVSRFVRSKNMCSNLNAVLCKLAMIFYGF